MGSISDRVISYQFRGNFTSLTAGLTAAGRGVQDFGSRLTALDAQGARMRAGLNSVGNSAGRIGLVAAAGLGAVIAVTTKFESAMSRVSAATNASAGDLEKLRSAAIKAGADTVFSAGEAADGITELGKAGLSTSDILSGGLTGALNLAAAGQIGVADAANTTATTLQQFGLAGDQASRVADVLAASANKAMGDVGDMSEALKYVGPVAAQMGLSLEDTAGAIAELAQQGILGSQAGTSLRGMMTSLTSPSKQARLTMEGLGISMYDAQGKFIGLDGVAGQLHDTMSGLTDAQRDEALGRIFGNEQITAARILYAGGAEAVQSWTDKVTDSGFAAQQAATLTNNLAGDIEQLKGSLETALIETGSSSQGPLRGMVQNLTDIVNGYSGLPGPAKTATAAALGLTAALGGGTFLFAKAIGGLASLQTSMMSMGVSAERAAASTRMIGRVGGAVAGLGLLAAGFASTNKAMAGFEGAAGGALFGFSVGGPWGAAIGGAIGLVATLGKTHGASAAEVDALTSTLDAQTGALTENSREWAIKSLRDSGALDTANALGINLATVTDAALGNAAAIKEVNAAVEEYQSLHSGDDGKDKAARGVAGGLSSAIGDTGGVLALSREQFKQHAEAMGQDAAAADQTSGAMAGLTAATTAAGGAAYMTAEDVAAAAKAQEEATKAANATATAFFNLGGSLNDSKVSLNDWITDLQKQANALRDFRVNAEKAADQGLRKGLIAALQEAGPEGAMRLEQLANASESEIGRANKAWRRGQGQINAYTDAVGNVPSSATTVVVVRDESAYSKIAAVKRELASIDRNIDIYVNIRKPNGGGMGPQVGGSADGGEVVGAPRLPYRDKVLYALAPGEEIISNRHGQADRFRSDRAAGIIPGYADGGTTGDKTKTKSKPPRRTANLISDDLDLSHGLKAALRDLKHDLSDLDKQVQRSTDAVDAETSARDALQGQFDSLSSSISGQFQSDLFSASGGNAFSSNAASDPIGVLMSDIANSQQFQSLFAGLKSAGLSGGALSAAAQGGTSALQTLSGYSAAQLAQYQSLYGQREQLAAASGQQVAQAQFGTQLDQANVYLAQLVAKEDQVLAAQRDVKQAVNQGEKATKEISSSTAKGHRSKPRGKK